VCESSKRLIAKIILYSYLRIVLPFYYIRYYASGNLKARATPEKAVWENFGVVTLMFKSNVVAFTGTVENFLVWIE
jgi:hypothetical protein